MILGGANQIAPDKIAAYQLGSLRVIQFAFLAAYIWALWQLFQRMVNRDVTVYAFHVITIRVITTIILSLTIYHGFSGKAPPEISRGFDMFILIAFGIGFFPEVVLRWLGARARTFFQMGEPSSYLDIESIEGIDTFTRARLAEAGVADAGHLATSNPVTLAIRTPFNLPQLVDWAGQAQLLMLIKEDNFNRLRNHAIRTSYQFYGQFHGLAAPKLPGDATIDVQFACASLDIDPSFRRLNELVERMLREPTSNQALHDPDRAEPEPAAA